MEISYKEFVELYGDVELEFDYYYKYMFVFKGETEDGHKVSVSVGGCADDIYKMEVHTGQEYMVKDLEGTYGTVYRNGDLTDVLHSFYEGY